MKSLTDLISLNTGSIMTFYTESCTVSLFGSSHQRSRNKIVFFLNL